MASVARYGTFSTEADVHDDGISHTNEAPHTCHNECPRALLCLVFCAGRAQSCFLTILRIPSALLTRLTNSPCTCILHPAPWILYPIAAPHPCICAYSFAPRYNINLYCTPQPAHARQHQPQPHMRRIISASWRPHQTHPKCGAMYAHICIMHTRAYTIARLCMHVPFTFTSRARRKSCARRAIVSGAMRHIAIQHARRSAAR